MNGCEMLGLAMHVFLLLLPLLQCASRSEHLDVSICLTLWALSEELQQIPMLSTYDVNVLAIFLVSILTF